MLKGSSTTSSVVDDKSPICIPFVLEQIAKHKAKFPGRPFFLGLNGVQGSGKTTLVVALASTLTEKHGLVTLACSIDEFYLRHEDQLDLARKNPSNTLVQVRGQPGTHDVDLIHDFFACMNNSQPTKVPQYDKSAFNGQGDRVPDSQWRLINGPGQLKVEVIIFEGWCVGFKSLPMRHIQEKRLRQNRTLKLHKLEHLEYVNAQLERYDTVTNHLDAFIHLDAQNIQWVYDWRLEQEVKLRLDRGSGMLDEEVKRFIDAYYPAYELYIEDLRRGLFDESGHQLTLVISKDRKVIQTAII